MKNFKIFAAMASAICLVSACSDPESADEIIDAPQEALVPVETGNAKPAQAPMPTGEILENVEDPSMPAPSNTAASGGSISAFNKKSAVNSGAIEGVNVQNYRQQAENVANANRQMEAGVNQITDQ